MFLATGLNIFFATFFSVFGFILFFIILFTIFFYKKEYDSQEDLECCVEHFIIRVDYINGKTSRYEINTNCIELFISKVLDVSNTINITSLGVEIGKSDYFEFNDSVLDNNDDFQITKVCHNNYLNKTVKGKELFNNTYLLSVWDKTIIRRVKEGK